MSSAFFLWYINITSSLPSGGSIISCIFFFLALNITLKKPALWPLGASSFSDHSGIYLKEELQDYDIYILSFVIYFKNLIRTHQTKAHFSSLSGLSLYLEYPFLEISVPEIFHSLST